jgi:hypothetical protein
MTNEHSLTIFDPAAIGLIISESTGQLDLPTTGTPVDWLSIREAVDPQGELIKASDLVGIPFVVRRLKPFLSQFAGAREVVYWLVGQDETGRIFNTVLGGVAVCEALDNIVQLNKMLYDAYKRQDTQEIEHLRSVGAGQPIRLTLDYKKGGKYNGYFTFG